MDKLLIEAAGRAVSIEVCTSRRGKAFQMSDNLRPTRATATTYSAADASAAAVMAASQLVMLFVSRKAKNSEDLHRLNLIRAKRIGELAAAILRELPQPG